MREEFQSHKLNEHGLELCLLIGAKFDDLLTWLEKKFSVAEPGQGYSSREHAIVRTKLEEACFYAKKMLASSKENQE